MQRTVNIETLTRFAQAKRPTVQNTYDLSLALLRENVQGCFVECGVYRGAQVAAMMLAMLHAGRRRTIHLFDSFQGIPHAGAMDDEAPGIGKKPDNHFGQLISTGISACSAELVRKTMKDWFGPDHGFEHVYYEGWFQHTVEPSDTGPIALLRLDGDLYESTKVCIDHLYPRVVEDGIVIVDDYALAGCRKACNELLPGVEMTVIEGGGGPVWFRKGTQGCVTTASTESRLSSSTGSPTAT